MAFDCRNFLEVAEDMLTSPKGGHQAYLRTIAGRAYYSTYGTLRERLQAECGANFGRGGKHGALARCCALSDDAHIAKIGKRLQTLLDYRVQADYSDPLHDLSTTEGELAVDTASRLLSKIDRLAPSQLEEIRDAIGI